MDEHLDDESPFEVVFDHLHARGRGDVEAVAARLHPGVVQQGVEPELVCHGRDMVLKRISTNMARTHGGMEWLELLERNGRVVAGFGGARFAGNPLLTDRRLFIVFTVRAGLIERMDHFRSREEAVAAADAAVAAPSKAGADGGPGRW